MKEKARLLWRTWESWNESAGPGLQSQCYSGLLGTGDLIANFWKQPPVFKYWQEIKTVWLLDICVTPFKLSGPVLRIPENCLKHVWNLVHTERDLRNIGGTQLKICASLFCILPFPGVKRMTLLYRRQSIKFPDGTKTALYSEGLSTVVQLNYSFKRAYCKYAALAVSVSPPARLLAYGRRGQQELVKQQNSSQSLFFTISGVWRRVRHACYEQVPSKIWKILVYGSSSLILSNLVDFL